MHGVQCIQLSGDNVICKLYNKEDLCQTVRTLMHDLRQNCLVFGML